MKCVCDNHGRNEGGTILRAPNHCGGAKEKSQCHTYIFQYFASKDLRLVHKGAKLASYAAAI